jgi:hypothetical protein
MKLNVDEIYVGGNIMTKLCKIIDISELDAFYPYRYTLIGLTGYFDVEVYDENKEYAGGNFVFQKPISKLGVLRNVDSLILYRVKVDSAV